MPDKEPSRAGTQRGWPPFVWAAVFALAVFAAGTIFVAQQITIGPFDEEGSPGDIRFATEYRAFIVPADRTDDRGAPLTDVLAILKRDRENYHQFQVRQSGDTADVSSAGGNYFAHEMSRADIASAELSIPNALKDRLLVHDTNIHVLVHERNLGPRLLISVSAAPDIND